MVDIFTFVFTHGIAIVDPQERAYLHLLVGLAKLGKAIGRNLHDLAGTYVVTCLITQVGETARLRRDGISFRALAYKYRGAAILVACGNDAVLGKEKHRAGTFEFVLHILDTVDIIFTFGNEGSYQLGLVGYAVAVLAKVVPLVEELFFEVGQIVDLCHGDDGKFAEVATEYDRLCIGIADDTDTRIARKGRQIGFEFGSEIRTFDIVNRTGEIAFVKGHHSTAFGSQVRIIVDTVVKIGYAVCFFYGSKKTAHTCQD